MLILATAGIEPDETISEPNTHNHGCFLYGNAHIRCDAPFRSLLWTCVRPPSAAPTTLLTLQTKDESETQ